MLESVQPLDPNMHLFTGELLPDREHPAGLAIVPGNEPALGDPLARPNSFTSLLAEDRGAFTLELGQQVANTGALAINGIRRWITEKRLGRKENLVEKLEVSTDALRHYAARVLPDTQPIAANFVARTAGAAAARKAEQKQQKHDPTLAPITHSERAAERRASKRMSKAIETRATTQYRQQRVWGGADNDLGTAAYRVRIDNERMTRMARGRALRADRHYRKREKLVDAQVAKVSKSAEGRDVPATIRSIRISRNQRISTELQAHLLDLDLARQARLARRRPHP